MSFSPSSSSSNSSGSRVLEWELGLPSADDLTPLSQTLIPPSLASAFSISSHPSLSPLDLDLASRTSFNALAAAEDPSPNPNDPPPSKRARLVWTPQLHRRFVDVVSHLGVANAVPKTVMQMMNVEGLTRENVASHLQKYRLYLKRVNDPNPPAGSDAGFFDSAPDPISAQKQQQKQQQQPMQYMMQMPVFHNYGFYDTYHR